MSMLQSIEEYNGGSVVAMAGKECVAIASDLRLGNQAVGISSNFQRVSQCHNDSSMLCAEGSKGFPYNRSHLSWTTRPCNRRFNTVCRRFLVYRPVTHVEIFNTGESVSDIESTCTPSKKSERSRRKLSPI